MARARSYIYDVPGTFEIVLTVTDADGNTGSDKINIIVLSGLEISMHVSDISMDINYRGVNSMGVAKIVIVNEYGNPIDNTLVSGTWSRIVQDSQAGFTTSDGSVIFTSPKTKKTGSIVFTIENISVADYSYHLENNNETWDSVEIP